MSEKKEALVPWVDYDEQAAAEEEKQAAEMADRAEFMKIKEGKTIVRILPPLADWGRKSPFVKVSQHYLDQPGGGGRMVFACPRVMEKKHCPVCAFAERLTRSGNPADRDAAYELRPQFKAFVNVINRKEPDKGVVVLALPQGVYKDLVNLRSNEDVGGNYSDPGPGGFDVIIDRVGTGKKDTRYKVYIARKPSPLGNNDWIMSQTDLGRFAVPHRLDDVEQAVQEMEGAPAREEAQPAMRQGSRRTVVDVEAEDIDE